MGGLTPELELVRDIATAGLLIGGSLGAMMNARLAIAKFVERNQATPFESQIVAKVGGREVILNQCCFLWEIEDSC